MKVKALKDIQWRRPKANTVVDSCKSGDVVDVPEELANAWVESKKAELVAPKKDAPKSAPKKDAPKSEKED